MKPLIRFCSFVCFWVFCCCCLWGCFFFFLQNSFSLWKRQSKGEMCSGPLKGIVVPWEEPWEGRGLSLPAEPAPRCFLDRGGSALEMLPLWKEGFISYCGGRIFLPPSLLSSPCFFPPLFLPSFSAESLLFIFSLCLSLSVSLSFFPRREQGFVQISSSLVTSFVTLDTI